MEKIIIVGGSGFALEAAWLAEECGYSLAGFLDDDHKKKGLSIMGKPVLGEIDDWVKFQDHCFVVGIGSPRIREKIVQRMEGKGSPSYATLVHPRVERSSYVEIGQGSIVCAGCVFTVDVKLGKHCIVNLNSTIGHETTVGDYVTIAPIAAISGNVTLADLSEVGTGASVRQGLSIGRGSLVGMGAVLTKNVNEHEVFAGNPAKFLKKIEMV